MANPDQKAEGVSATLAQRLVIIISVDMGDLITLQFLIKTRLSLKPLKLVLLGLRPIIYLASQGQIALGCPMDDYRHLRAKESHMTRMMTPRTTREHLSLGLYASIELGIVGDHTAQLFDKWIITMCMIRVIVDGMEHAFSWASFFFSFVLG